MTFTQQLPLSCFLVSAVQQDFFTVLQQDTFTLQLLLSPPLDWAVRPGVKNRASMAMIRMTNLMLLSLGFGM
jgi:hypothetical protein